MDHDVWKKFEENNLTHSAAHHLLAILDLRKERGYARVTDVAKYLNITTGSASTNLKSLKTKGLIVEDDNKFLSLSPLGETLAKGVVARKEIFQKFLVDILGVSDDQAEIDACKTEHLLSNETSHRLMEFMQRELPSSKGVGSKKKTQKKRGTSSKPACPVTLGVIESVEDCRVCEDHCLLEDC